MEEAEENRRPEGGGGCLVRKGSKRKLLASTASDPPKIREDAKYLLCTYRMPGTFTAIVSFNLLYSMEKLVPLLTHFTGEIIEAQRVSIASPKVPQGK